jgi:hypothetical protein
VNLRKPDAGGSKERVMEATALRILTKDTRPSCFGSLRLLVSFRRTRRMEYEYVKLQ